MKIGIIGAGLIGRKRALALPKGVLLKAVCDLNEPLAKKFAEEFSCSYSTKPSELFNDSEIEAVFIATPNGSLADLAVEAIKCGKHVLVEKPGGIDKKEIEKIGDAQRKNPVVVMFGYNHRFHPAIQKAKEVVASSKYGDVLFIRAKYGHGGRLGYEKEWRFKKELSGGGELVDQGSHLIDLTNFFIGEMKSLKSLTGTFFWQTKLEDTAFMLLRNDKGQAASLSVSCVEWKNLFNLEIMLKTAKIQIDGLGGSYGTEKMTLYLMKPQMGPPDVKELIFDEPDTSWAKENKMFFERIAKKDYSNDSINEAAYVFDIIGRVYEENKDIHVE